MTRTLIIAFILAFTAFTPIFAAEEEEAAPQSIDSFGLLSGSEGYGEKLWDNFNRKEVEALMPKLPSKSRSTTLRELTRKLVLTKADAPVGDGTPGKIYTARLEHLVNLGDYESALKMMDILDGDLMDDARKELKAKAEALQSSAAEAAEPPKPSKTAASRLAPFAAFVTVSEKSATWKPDQVLPWLASSKAANKAHIAAKALVLMESMGEKVPASSWQKVTPLSPPQKGTTAFEDYLWNMDKAAYAGKKGETVVYALAALGPNGLTKLHPSVVGRILNALKTVGLKNEASLLAAESLLE